MNILDLCSLSKVSEGFQRIVVKTIYNEVKEGSIH